MKVTIEFDGPDYWRRWADQAREEDHAPDSFVELLEALADAFEEDDAWQMVEGTIRSMSVHDLEYAAGRFLRMSHDWSEVPGSAPVRLGVLGLVKRLDRELTKRGRER